MAFKNQTSYAIGTRYGGLKVINQTDPTYSAGFPEDKGNLWDMVYIRHLNCYLYVQEDNQIHRKDIDEDPPCLFMGLDCGSQPGKFFKYSKLNRRLIVRRRDKRTAVVNLERKMVEIAIRKRQGSETIEDSKYSSVRRQRGPDCLGASLRLSCVSYELKKILFKQRHHIPATQEKERDAPSKCLVVGGEGNYILVGFRRSVRFRSSPMTIYELKSSSSVAHLARLDQSRLWRPLKSSVSFYSSFGQKLVWVALSTNSASTYYFNRQSEELRGS